MTERELLIELPLYMVLLVVTFFYTLVWWRIFNKARHSGVLLTWVLIQAAAWPWIAEPDPWIVVTALAVSFLVSLGIVSAMVSIIGRPGWWVLPVVLAFTPQLVIVIWRMQASAFEELPDALAWFAVASWCLAAVMSVPLYFVGMHDLGDAFGYGIWFQVGLMLLPFVFLPILAFDSNYYGDWGKAERERRARRQHGPVIPAAIPGSPGTGGSGPTTNASLPPLNSTATAAGSSAMENGQPGPGWYDNPDGSGNLRWWDGTKWTDRVDERGHRDTEAGQRELH